MQNKDEKSIVWNGVGSKVEKPSEKDKSMPIPDGWAKHCTTSRILCGKARTPTQIIQNFPRQEGRFIVYKEEHIDVPY
ncbi:hypothetical protein RGU11_01885 [Rossellomorea marisflavi]|uniref:hypothetical protein n=1 Tax=Rossellomorea marisflavi TaxID=189381 RepID=UPI0028535BBB|nr:hypothetical protein [Rossellomorea marisflavi]MDR4935127.1 hypothetical protein [Rossellomorea marisflavi]